MVQDPRVDTRARSRMAWWLKVRRRGARRFKFGFATHDDIFGEMENHGVNIRRYSINLDDFWSFVDGCGYRDSSYYAGGDQFCAENKWLEHYVSVDLLKPQPGDVLIDIANCHSPFPDVLREHYGVETYKQDLIYQPGINGDTIGGNAAQLPVPDEFADHLTLHCSLEHFEGDSDQGFIREAERILKPGGRVCIVPLYTHASYVIQTDPNTWKGSGLRFEKDATVHIVHGWGERHGRMYDAPHFLQRIVANLGSMRLSIFALQNYSDVWNQCYLKFAALIQKPE